MRFPSRSESFDRIREKVISGQAALEFGDSAQALTLLDEAVGQVLALDWSDEAVWKRWPVMQGVLQFAKQYLAQEIAESSLAPDVSDNSDEPRFLTSIPELMIVNREMRAIIDQIVRIRHTRMNVLITGESGVGKELLAKAIHLESDLRDNVYIPFNCAAVAPELLESRLFGHRRGAFTGA
ncbi:MAG TPA: sigma 54-interacting transcriptional regulator, partial [Acidobacteriota bacterium]|nr:sigma 54-interacting transcriptional regulator [Acidobacteriota bacterium]